MPAGIYDLAIEVFRKIPWEGIFSRFRTRSRRLSALVQQGDELDHFGLYQDAISIYLKALGEKPASSVLLLKLANSHWKLRNYDQATGFLNDAKLYADSSKARYAVCQLEVQLLFVQAERQPSTPLFEECLKLLDQALQEQPGCCLATGRKALVALEALKALPDLGEQAMNRYQKLAQHAFLQCLKLNAGDHPTQLRHLKQILMELNDYQAQTNPSSFWKSKIEEGHRLLAKASSQPLKSGRSRRLYSLLTPVLLAVLRLGIGMLDNIDIG